MTHRYIKIGAHRGSSSSLAFVGLMWSTLREGTEYYKHVDEVMANQQAVAGQAAAAARLRRAGSILRKPNTLEYKFKVQNNPRAAQAGDIVEARTPASCPTRSRTRRRSVLKGKLTPDGFHAEPNGVMAKCPSKYEAAEKSAASGILEPWPPSASFLLLAAFVVCSYAGRRLGRRRAAAGRGALIESGIGAFYLVCALMTAARRR